MSPSSKKRDTPPGWRKVVKIRQSGKTQGRRDVYLYSPDNVKLRSRIELAKYLKDTKSTYTLEDFKFSSSPSSKDRILKKKNNKVSSKNKIKEKKVAPKEKSKKSSVGKSKAGPFKNRVKSIKTPGFSSKDLLKSYKRSPSPVNSVAGSSDSSDESLDVSPRNKSKSRRKATNKPPLMSRCLPIAKFKAVPKSRAKKSVKKLPAKASQKSSKSTGKSVKSTGSSKCQVSSLIQDISDIYAPSTSGCRARRSIKSPSPSASSSRSGGSSPPLNVYIPASCYPQVKKTKKAAGKTNKAQSKSRSNDSSSKSGTTAKSATSLSHDVPTIVEAEEDPIPIGENGKQALPTPPSDEISKSSEESIETSLNASESTKCFEENDASSKSRESPKLSEKTPKSSPDASTKSGASPKLSDKSPQMSSTRSAINSKSSISSATSVNGHSSSDCKTKKLDKTSSSSKSSEKSSNSSSGKPKVISKSNAGSIISDVNAVSASTNRDVKSTSKAIKKATQKK